MSVSRVSNWCPLSVCARLRLRLRAYLAASLARQVLYVLVEVNTTVRELAERSLGLEGYFTDTMSADILSSTPLCGLSTGFHPIRRAVVPAACSGSGNGSQHVCAWLLMDTAVYSRSQRQPLCRGMISKSLVSSEVVGGQEVALAKLKRPNSKVLAGGPHPNLGFCWGYLTRNSPPAIFQHPTLTKTFRACT